MKHRPLIFIDVETTGGNARTGKIIDIGAIRVENGVVVQRMNQLVNPNRHVSSFITKLTGITNEMLWSAPSFEAVAPQLEALLDGGLLIAHHVQFDYSFIRSEFAGIGIAFATDRACTVKLSRLIDSTYRRHSLDSIIERLDVEVKHRHRGYDDAEVLWKYMQFSEHRMGLELYHKLSSVTTYSPNRDHIVTNQLEFALSSE